MSARPYEENGRTLVVLNDIVFERWLRLASQSANLLDSRSLERGGVSSCWLVPHEVSFPRSPLLCTLTNQVVRWEFGIQGTAPDLLLSLCPHLGQAPTVS